MKKIMFSLALLIGTNALNCMDRNQGNDPKKQLIISNGEMHFIEPQEAHDGKSFARAYLFLQILLVTQDKRALKLPKSKL
jgi:hypothetical protein